MLVQVCTELGRTIGVPTGHAVDGEEAQPELVMAERLDRLTSSVILVSMGAFFYFLLSTSIYTEPLGISAPCSPHLDTALASAYM